ncbi:M28 family peptidase [Massilia sp. S19_KUP03_FR1]|uniref:M28 family peptidase n=1 Tax=Massilia sp. S19_KUP03_FR1 TaxID=3025503 RepID=UPI002FCD7109
MPTPRILPAIAALFLLVALAWLALSPTLAPPAPATAPATSFSAARAMRHVVVLAEAPRPLASDANAQARAYLVAQLRALGLDPQVQSATVQHNETDQLANVHVTLAVVHNVVVRKPGTTPGRPALLLATHYDSLATSAGAAHGGASTAALVETLRALQAAPALAQDLIVLFADAQAQHGMGAQGFVEQHPWAKQVGMVLKFDNAGNRGPLVLYDSAGADGAAIDGWAAHAPRARGSSLMRAVYPLMPHAVPVGPLANLRVPLLQFANVEGYTGPRGSGDTAERLDRAMLQHEGDTMLALARHFAGSGFQNGVAGQVYFTLPHVGVVHYSDSAVWPFTRLACLLLFGVACLGIQRSGVDAIALLKGVFGYALISAVMAAAAWVAWQMLPTHDGYEPLWQGISERDGWYQLACTAFCSAAFIAMQRRLQRRIGATAAALGALVCMALGLLVLSAWLPGASYALVWPMFAILSALGALYWRRVQAGGVWILLAGAAPAVFLLTPAIREAFCVMSLSRMNLPLLLLALLLGGAIMLLAAVARRYVVRTLALASLACMAVASSATPFRSALPEPNPLVYYKDQVTWRAYWLMHPKQLDAWTRQVFANASGPHVFTEVFGHGSHPLWYAPAPKTALAFPQIAVLKDDGEVHRHVEFTMHSQNRAPNIELWIERGKPVRTSVNGRLLTGHKSRNWALSLYGMQDQPLHFAIDMEGGSENFYVRVQEKIPGLPEQDLPPRPPSLKPVLTPLTGLTIASDTLLFR